MDVVRSVLRNTDQDQLADLLDERDGVSQSHATTVLAMYI
jgi:hypothetical protein